MSLVRTLAVLATLTFSVAAVGCAADDAGDDEGADSTSGAATSLCQIDNGRTVLGADCHDQAELDALCEKQARQDEELIQAIKPVTNSNSQWKYARCRFETRSVSVRCCDVS